MQRCVSIRTSPTESENPLIHHARTTWQEPSYPITGPAPKAKTTTAVIHYSASNNIRVFVIVAAAAEIKAGPAADALAERVLTS